MTIMESKNKGWRVMAQEIREESGMDVSFDCDGGQEDGLFCNHLTLRFKVAG